MDGTGFQCRWQQKIFSCPHPSRPAVGPTKPLVQWVSAFLPTVKGPEHGVYHPLPSSAEVKLVNLSLYPSLWTQRQVTEWYLPCSILWMELTFISPHTCMIICILGCSRVVRMFHVLPEDGRRACNRIVLIKKHEYCKIVINIYIYHYHHW